MTDSSLQALANAGCGENLTWLYLECEFLSLSLPSLSPLFLSLVLPSTTARNSGCPGISDRNFAAALGLPKEFHKDNLQAAYRHWRLRADQCLFLQEKVTELEEASLAVRLWDEQRGLFFFFFPWSSFSPSAG